MIGEETVAWLESGVTGLRGLEQRLGGGAVRGRVAADLAVVAGLLARGPHGPALDVRLFRTAADLALLGGRAAADSDLHGVAHRYFLTALRLAHSARDLPAAAGVWAALSRQAVLAGRPADALAVLDAADTAAEAATGAATGTAGRRTLAMLAGHRARALAGEGDEVACRHALDRARDLLAGAGNDGRGDGPDPGRFDAAALNALAGTALLALGRHHEAAALLEDALAAQDPARVRDRALRTVRAATARLRMGDREAALALHTAAAGLLPGLESRRAAAALNALTAELRGPVSPGRARNAHAG